MAIQSKRALCVVLFRRNGSSRRDFNIAQNKPVRSYLNFVLGGGMIEIETKEQPQRQLKLIV